jgi:hypothetical protein
MITFKGIVTTVAIVAACCVPQAADASWHSNTFQSPSGNLICKFRPSFGRISCGAFSSQKIITMGTYSRPLQGQRISWDHDAFPVLGYGWTWSAGQPISCRSLTTGMRCQNAAGWFFVIDRSAIFVGRYGQRLYSL